MAYDYQTRQRSWSSPTAFLDERTVAAEHEDEWTAGATIYAHYLRWSYLTGCSARQKKAFVKPLRDRSQEKDLNGIRIFSLRLLDPGKRKEQVEERLGDVVLGEVIVKTDLKFMDGILKTGTVVQHMSATDSEKADIDNKKKRQRQGGETSFSWLVISWLNRRRRVPGDAVERVC